MTSSRPRGPTTTQTKKYISSNIFLEIITMLYELCITVTMRLVAVGHSLYEAQYLAALVVLQLVLLCTLLGYRIVRPDEDRPGYRAVNVPVYVVVGMRGLIPATAGTAGRASRTFLQE
jgi:hypothetical protein